MECMQQSSVAARHRSCRHAKGDTMKLRLGIVLCAVLVTTPVVAAEKQELKTQKDKVSYVIGLDMWNRLKKDMVDVDTENLRRGLKDALSGASPLMSEQEMKGT